MDKFVDKYDSVLQRIFEIIPGLLLWVLLLVPVWGGYSIPIIVINVLIVLTAYWLYRAIAMFVGLFIGYRIYKKDIKKDWLSECNNLDFSNLPDKDTLPKDTRLPKHLIVIPNYGEDYDILCRSIQALVNQNYPRELIYLAVSIEERKAQKDEDYAKRGEYLKRDFGDYFENRLMFFVHPLGLPGEVIGAGSNRRWGAKSAVEVLEKNGENINDFLITAPDGDIVFDKNYLAAVSYKYLTVPKRIQRFYQTAVYTFNNNYWDVPILIRILSTGLTLPILASSVLEKQRRETYSCFSLNLKVMKDVDYWDASLAIDDTTFYWKPYQHFHGDWLCEVFFIPLHADAVHDANYVKNHFAQYKQYLRWGWGVISVPLALKTLLRDSKVSLIEKFTKVFHLFEVFVLWKVLAFLLTFGIPIILFINRDLDDLVISHTIPQTVSRIMTFSVMFLIPTTYYKMKLTPPRPKGMSKKKYWALFLLEAPLNIVVILSFSTLPFIEATTRLMLGGNKNNKLIGKTWTQKQMKK